MGGYYIEFVNLIFSLCTKLLINFTDFILTWILTFLRVDNVLKSGDISWRCTNKKCKGRVRTDSSISTIVPVNMDHTHDRNDKKWRGNSCAFKSYIRRLMI